MPEDPTRGGVVAQAEAVAASRLTASDLLEQTLARIEALDPTLNAFTVVLTEQARAEAAERDVAQQRGDALGPLHGVPVAIKEENVVAGTVTTLGGSANRTPATEDGHVTRLLREAGAVVVGKTNMPEFGLFPFTESVAHGITRNPWRTTHTPGGSSGGTAAAVASGMVAVGIGGDGGGSIRIPSACCGLFGLKPSRGLVSSAPLGDLWQALGTVGPLTRSVLDSAVVYDVIRGNEPVDRWTAPEPPSSYAEAARLSADGAQRRLRVGWSTTPHTRGMRPAPEHVAAVEETAALLEGLGHEVVEIDPRYPDATAAFLPQLFAGIRDEAALVEDRSRLEPRIKQTVAMGAWARPAVVRRAIARGDRLADRVDERVFSRCDVLLTPTLAERPPQTPVLGRKPAPVALLRSMPMIAYTALWNVTGHPAAALPTGIADDGLPVSVQLVGRRFDEVTLFALAAQIESVRPWADRWPEVGA
ncbi:amidase [Nocardioides sp. HDW12B]|nr:amidase [Nocardioides sp. HDW12B]